MVTRQGSGLYSTGATTSSVGLMMLPSGLLLVNNLIVPYKGSRYNVLHAWFQVDQQIESCTCPLSPSIHFSFPEYGTLSVELAWRYSRDTEASSGKLHVDSVCEAKHPHLWSRSILWMYVVLDAHERFCAFIGYPCVDYNWRMLLLGQDSLTLWTPSLYCSDQWVLTIPAQICRPHTKHSSLLPSCSCNNIRHTMNNWVDDSKCFRSCFCSSVCIDNNAWK